MRAGGSTTRTWQPKGGSSRWSMLVKAATLFC